MSPPPLGCVTAIVLVLLLVAALAFVYLAGTTPVGR